MNKLSILGLSSWLALATFAGCSSEEAANTTEPAQNGSLNVSQGGPQDFAQFRAIVESGEIPAPAILDDVGFFAEHAVDLPPAECGHDVCVHPFLAVMPRFNGGNWTMAFIAMNTPVDAAALERPPIHLVLAVEEAEPFFGYGGALAAAAPLLDALERGDRVSILSYGRSVTTHALALRGVSEEAEAALAALGGEIAPAPYVDLYQGLAGADRALRALPDWEGASRVVLLTTGRADVGIVDRDRIVGLGEALARGGTSLSIIGLGEDYDATLGSALGTIGAGSYSFAKDAADLVDVLELEAATTLFPLATDFRATLRPAPGYRVGRIYGVDRAHAHEGEATLDLPALFIGRRQGAHDVGGGRRGGGGGLFVELLADPLADVGPDQPAFTLESRWREAGGEVEETQTIVNPLAPAQNPDGMWPYFSDEERGKPYMMLNMYLALRAAVDFYDGGDCNRAVGVIDMMRPSIEGWQARYSDPDLDDDYVLMLLLRENLVSHCEAKAAIAPLAPVYFDGGCGFL
jgi:Ca-activated chloride channel family protein